MATSNILPNLLLLFFLLFYFSASTAIDIQIHHSTPPSSADSPLSSILQLARSADPARLSLLFSQKKTSGGTSVPIASGQNLLQTPSYILRASLGSPPQALLLSLDTGSDSAWLPCSPCSSCTPAAPPFSPSNSSSFSPLPCSSPLCPLLNAASQPPCYAPSSPCSYSQSYADSSFTAALSRDSLRLALDVIPNYVFGCVTSVAGPTIPKQGLLGLGRGPLSLLSQTGDLYKGVFSYCLPSYKSYYFSGSLRLGPAGQPHYARFTPLLKNPHRPSLYYVNMTGISVGRVKVVVPGQPGAFGFDPATGAGTVVDSGTVVSRFTAPIYAALREEFRRQVNASGAGGFSSLGVFDTCFSTDEVGATPPITLHMDGGVDLTLPVESTLIHSSATPLACLAMAEAPPNVNAVVNVLANLQQQNLRVVLDVANSRVGFARELCN